VEPALREHGGELGQPDHKSALQEWLQARGQPAAEYRLVGTEGPDHRKRFWIEVGVGGRALATAEGDSKKEAEQAAARLALERLREAQA
jgi:ribonuclease-3